MKKIISKLILTLLACCALTLIFVSCNSESGVPQDSKPSEELSGSGTEQSGDTGKPDHSDTIKDPPAHTCVFDKKVTTDNYKKFEATCTSEAVYCFSCACGATGTETFEYGEKLAHTYDRQVATEKHLKTPETYTEGAVYYYSCKCGENGTETFTVPTSHVHAYNQISTDAKHLVSGASCTAKAIYNYSCICGATGTETFEYGEKLAHAYGTDDICTACGSVRATEGLKFTLNSDGKSYSVSKIGQATDFKIVIPSEYNSKPVTAIAPSAFAGERWFTDIMIPDSITSIGEKAFYECTGLINVTLGDGVTSIGENAFYHCTGLKDIKVGTALSEIGVDAFKECTGLLYVRITDVNAWCKIDFANIASNPVCYTHSLYLNDTLITDLVIRGSGKIRIGKWAFYTCTALTSLDIQSGVFSIGEQAFYGCDGMETLTIGNGVVVVDNSAFADCDKLETVTVGKDVTTLNQSAFESCDKLTTLVMGNGITNIGNRVFYNCAKLENITWSQVVTSVGDEMLGYCTSLKILDLPISVTYVGDGLIIGCTSMETVVLPFIGSSKNLSLGETSQFSYMFGNGTMPTSLKNITVLSGHIDADDFVGCASVKTITFGTSVAAIDTTSLASCVALEAITVDDAHTLYATENGILYNKAKTQILFIPLGCMGSLTVSNGNLTKALLNGCSKITDITIDAGVTYEDGAFAGTTGLKTLTLPTLNTTALALFGGAEYVPASFETLTITSQSLTTGSAELAGCNFDVVLSNKYMIGIEVQAKSSAYSDEFWNGSENKIKVLMNDGTHSFVTLLPSHLSTAHQNLLYTKGTHTVTATYQGFSDEFTVTLKNHTFSGIIFEDQSIIIDDVGSIYISGKPSFASVSYVGNNQTTDGDHTVTATVSAPYYDDLVLSATMTIKHKKYNINYIMGNNGSQNPNAAQYTYGEVFTFSDPYYANGEFVGWYSDSGFTTPITQISAGCYGEVTVYAKFNTMFTYEGNTITGLGELGKTMSEITIPSSIDGVEITSIGHEAFSHCQNLEHVSISSGITDIEYEAFYSCRNLVSVTMPNGIIYIGDSAFNNCYRLTSVNLPSTLQYIYDRAFFGCNVLANVEIPDNLIGMGKWAFDGCPVEELENGIAYVDGWAYRVGGSSIIFRDGTIGIADNIASYNQTITELYIPNTVKYIGRDAFYCCTSLKSVTIGNSVVSIGYSAFSNCTSLKSVTIPDGVISIGEHAFSDCTSLESVSVSAESIGYCAFYYCTSLKSVTIGNSVVSIGYSAFENCTALTEINFNATAMNNLSNESYAVFFDAGQEGDGITVNIGANVTKIPAYLFSPCHTSSYAHQSKITNVVFAANSQCKSIDEYAFWHCDSLTSVTVPDGIESIGIGAFWGCTSLKSVTIGDSVTSIGYYAFSDCTSLASIIFEDTSTWYRTNNESNWNNNAGGTQTTVTTPSTNATYFTSTYCDYYWYKE